MMTLAENRDLFCFLVTKHSWKGKFKRIFSIGTTAISTYNPSTLEITNQWLYEDFISIKPIPRSAQSQDEFTIQVRMKKRVDNMRFSSENVADIITTVLERQSIFRFGTQPVKYPGYKHDWSDRRIPIILQANSYALEQVDNQQHVLASYKYKSILQIIKISSSYPGGFIIEYGEQRRRHLFASEKYDELIEYMRKIAGEYIGIALSVTNESLSTNDFMQTRLGICSRDEQLTSYVEFKVQKFSSRHEKPVRRLLCLSESCIIERDPATYCPICAHLLKSIICMTRDENDPQKFTIVYEDNESKVYSSAERDLILASLMDGSRASGNLNVHVLGSSYQYSFRLLPHGFLLDEDSESLCMRHIISPPPGLKRCDLIRRFNFNIPYSGLTYSVSQEGFFSENKGKLIIGCLEAVLGELYPVDEISSVSKCEAQLYCLRRLFASKSGFQAFTAVAGIREKLGNLVIIMLKLANEMIDHATVEMLCSLMHPMHSNYELRYEQLNKQSLLSTRQFIEHLLDLIVKHVVNFYYDLFSLIDVFM
ncbi:unnamed protein product [Dracunculus medinensis]|uniref:RME-8_N domain-containing protein n=1 Tax=Dracunculus medinensis TaxID=318479 RepID=A0A0N4U630_DRAME|nr:unnamed protein product [Dracunculus medinensis]